MAARQQSKPAGKAVEKAPKPPKTARFEARIDDQLHAAIEEIVDTFKGVGTLSSVGCLVLEMGVRCFWQNRAGAVPLNSQAVMARVAAQFGVH